MFRERESRVAPQTRRSYLPCDTMIGVKRNSILLED
jgi:hypothetical protein